jgi:Bax protein
MSRHLPLLLVAGISLGMIASHFQISGQLMASISGPNSHMARVKKPDFSAIDSVKERKQTFFAFIEAFVEERNLEILKLRERIEANSVNKDELLALAKRYRIKSDDPDIIRQRLMVKVDTLPSSLVLAQAAMESAWGTSRFAVEGNNYFGQWCFSEGCGLVPESRGDGKRHEVRLFESPKASVKSYMRNLNSHPAYKELRQTRAKLRQQEMDLNGCYLARGLTRYSEKGDAYVETLKQLIRVNDLEADPKDYCAPTLIAKETTAQSSEAQEPATNKPQEIAEDETQSSSTPLTSSDTPPSS